MQKKGKKMDNNISDDRMSFQFPTQEGKMLKKIGSCLSQKSKSEN